MKHECPKYLLWKQKNKKKRYAKARAALEEDGALSNSDSGTNDCSWPQQAMSAVISNKREENFKKEWYLDSAASSHMTNDITFVDEIDTTYRSKER